MRKRRRPGESNPSEDMTLGDLTGCITPLLDRPAAPASATTTGIAAVRMARSPALATSETGHQQPKMETPHLSALLSPAERRGGVCERW